MNHPRERKVGDDVSGTSRPTEHYFDLHRFS